MVPAALASFECRSSLVCCRWPWRAQLKVGERRWLEAELGMARELLVDSLERVPGRGRSRIAQRDKTCTLLSGAWCSLQQQGGLSGMPQCCRNFPRSVVSRERRVEVSFELACPTVVGLIIASREVFAWRERPSAGWPFSAKLTRATAPPWANGQPMGWSALDDLRHAWWEALDSAPDGELFGLLEALASGARHPDDAARGSSSGDLAHGFVPEAVVQLRWILDRLPKTGPRYAAAGDDLNVALGARRDAAMLRAPSADLYPILRRVAAHALPMAGVHDRLSVRQGFRRAGRIALLTASFWSRIGGVPRVDPTRRCRDAVVMAAHTARWALEDAASQEP